MKTDNTGFDFQLHGTFEHLKNPRSSFDLTYKKASVTELEKLIKSYIVSQAQGGKNEN